MSLVSNSNINTNREHPISSTGFLSIAPDKISEDANKIFLKIFEKLSVNDLVNVTLVCQNWKQIILANYDMLFHKVLFPVLKKYDFIYGNKENWSEADFYLTGEHHLSKTCKKLFGVITNWLAIYHPVVVLLESYPSMKKITDQTMLQKTIQNYYIHPSLIKKITFIGCDSDYIPDEWLTPSTCLLMEENCLYENKINELAQQIDFFQNLSMEDLIKLDIKILQEIANLPENLERIKKEHQLIQNELKLAIEATTQAITQRKKETFPQRTIDMVKTLKTMHQMLVGGTLKGKIVGSWGTSHLKTTSADHGIEEFRLNRLYETLDQLKVNVMIPKRLKKYYL